MARPDSLLADFATLFGRLRDHPDKNLILDLTKFCEKNIAIVAPELSDMIIARIIDPAIPSNWVLPIFYLMDSIMKNVGGSYPVLFSRHLGAVFERSFDQLSPKDKSKLDFLLGTWEERRMLPPDLLVYMRQLVETKKQQAVFGGNNFMNIIQAGPTVPRGSSDMTGTMSMMAATAAPMTVMLPPVGDHRILEAVSTRYTYLYCIVLRTIG